MNVFTDQVDSVRALTLPGGQPVKCVEYDSFGNVTADTRPEWRFALGFACGLNDSFTGFIRFGFRDYDPFFGRFTAKDPLGYTGGDYDLWDYCVDDPVSKYDPFGLDERYHSELTWAEKKFPLWLLGPKHPYTQERMDIGKNKYRQGLMNGGPGGIVDMHAITPGVLPGPSDKLRKRAAERQEQRRRDTGRALERYSNKPGTGGR